MSLRELAEKDLSLTLEDTNLAGSRFILIDKQKNKYELVGQVGDIGYLLNTDGVPVQGRTINVAYRMSSLAKLTDSVPCKGWKVEVQDLSGVKHKLHVFRYEPDRTIGIARLILSVELK